MRDRLRIKHGNVSDPSLDAGVGEGQGDLPDGGFLAASSCGNGFCEINEDHSSCSFDCCVTNYDGTCAAVCGNGGSEVGEALCPVAPIAVR